jgi:hypothetical protein
MYRLLIVTALVIPAHAIAEPGACHKCAEEYNACNQTAQGPLGPLPDAVQVCNNNFEGCLKVCKKESCFSRCNEDKTKLLEQCLGAFDPAKCGDKADCKEKMQAGIKECSTDAVKLYDECREGCDPKPKKKKEAQATE